MHGSHLTVPGELGDLGTLGPKDILSADHRALAVEAAKKSLVLLRNEEGTATSLVVVVWVWWWW